MVDRQAEQLEYRYALVDGCLSLAVCRQIRPTYLGQYALMLAPTKNPA